MTANLLPSRSGWGQTKVPLKPIRVTPSAYNQEMLQSTEERLANTDHMRPPRILELLDMSQTPLHNLSYVDLDQPLFQPYPSELVLQNFTPARTYVLPLRLDNRDKDYHHSLVFVTERERFEVPVRAIGPRAILDFRDEFLLPVCPVKATTEKTHMVYNTGNSAAKFKLHVQSPFSVTPSCGTLDVGGWMQVTVDFNPLTVGVYSQEMILHYHTGKYNHSFTRLACGQNKERHVFLLRKLKSAAYFQHMWDMLRSLMARGDIMAKVYLQDF
ncbi:Hydrocephalus-inducing [Liparis tanakae]|uniref:Hydrocephalus-inducing n=1 Tax=Liparis tanakae TaxID=230148 RepID=A0A4Z2I1P5_9TELE|nr:Hydrocephalus-inducing [Liparis tanakae]